MKKFIESMQRYFENDILRRGVISVMLAFTIFAYLPILIPLPWEGLVNGNFIFDPYGMLPYIMGINALIILIGVKNRKHISLFLGIYIAAMLWSLVGYLTLTFDDFISVFVKDSSFQCIILSLYCFVYAAKKELINDKKR